MGFDISKYRSGYSVSVGGIVVCGNKVLLVRRASDPRAGDWALPGGFVEHNETVQTAVQREVFAFISETLLPLRLVQS